MNNMKSIEELLSSPIYAPHINECCKFEKELINFLNKYKEDNETVQNLVFVGVMSTTVLTILIKSGWKKEDVELKFKSSINNMYGSGEE